MNDSPVEGCESAVESPPGATAARCVEQATADAISKKRIKVRMRSLLLRLLRGFKLKPRAPWGSMSNCRLERRSVPGAPGRVEWIYLWPRPPNPPPCIARGAGAREAMAKDGRAIIGGGR